MLIKIKKKKNTKNDYYRNSVYIKNELFLNEKFLYRFIDLFLFSYTLLNQRKGKKIQRVYPISY